MKTLTLDSLSSSFCKLKYKRMSCTTNTFIETAHDIVSMETFFPSLLQVTKRDEDSSLMQLKEEFRTYEALRREHDSQIVQIAMEGGLRIAPDQWSSLLYGDQSHKSHMQSIIDKVGRASIEKTNIASTKKTKYTSFTLY